MNQPEMWNWKDALETIDREKVKLLTSPQLQQLGVKNLSLKIVQTLEELRGDPPNIVIGECVHGVTFEQNRFKEQVLKKRVNYVMALGVYQQLHYIYNKRILKPSCLKFKNLYKPYIGQDLNDKSLLVTRTGGVGDLLFIQPNLLYIKEKYPGSYIKFSCGPQYQSMIETWDCVDEILDLPFPATQLINTDYHAIFEGVIERCKESTVTNAYNLFSKWLGIDLSDEKLIPKQEPKQEKIDECKEILKKWNLEGEPFFIVQIRASSPIRTPKPSFWIDLIDKLTDRDFNILITDSPHQSENVENFMSRLDNKGKVFNFCKYSKSIDYTIAITSLSKLSISTDSALIHIAQSVGTPAFGIYGPFPAFVRLKTYKNVDWVEGKLDCSPCFLHGQKPCPKSTTGYSPCYDTIDLYETVEKIGRLIND